VKIIAWGEKTGLRPFEDALSDSDIERVYRWSRDQEILKWSGGNPVELTLAEFKERIRHESAHPPTDRRMFFVVTREREMIGRVGCFALDESGKTGELGIVIGEREYWGMGYGRDATATLLTHLFDTSLLERINLYTYPENLRAQKCFAACGFRMLGASRRLSSDLGGFEGLEMEITRQEFLKLTHLTSSELSIPQGQT
jgi:RimJ/RimL family protein N-acetyltransferase